MGPLTALRIAFSVIWIYSLYYDVFYQPRLGFEYYIYKLTMLTNINFVVISVFSVFSTLSSFKQFSFLKSTTDFLLFTSVFPLAIVTCALFWGLYALNPELVMPAWVARLIPSWLNHVTHTLPVVYSLFELLCFARSPPLKYTAAVISALLVAIYFIVILVVRAVDGYWLYPVLSLLDAEHFLLGAIAAIFMWFILVQIASFISHSENNNKKTKRN